MPLILEISFVRASNVQSIFLRKLFRAEPELGNQFQLKRLPVLLWNVRCNLRNNGRDEHRIKNRTNHTEPRFRLHKGNHKQSVLRHFWDILLTFINFCQLTYFLYLVKVHQSMRQTGSKRRDFEISFTDPCARVSTFQPIWIQRHPTSLGTHEPISDFKVSGILKKTKTLDVLIFIQLHQK